MAVASPTCPRCGTALGTDGDCPACGSAAPTVSHSGAPSTGDARPAGTPAVWPGLLSAARGPDEVGRLGPYRVLGHLGTGGMGLVFRAEDPALRRVVALKVMQPELAANPTARARFLREAQAAAKVEHEHIVPIFQVGEDRDTAFLVMPLLKGQSLAALLKSTNGPLPLFDAVRIGREVAEGLAAAHAAALIHRDVKPANVWLEVPRQWVRILDFGLARTAAEVGAEDVTLTKEGSVVGSPAYMSPEQARAEPLDARTDLWSLGVVLYQMVTGKLPFRGTSRMAVLMAVGADTPEPPVRLNPRVPTSLNDLILGLLSKRPADRPASAADVARRLADIEVGLTAVPLADAADPGPPGDVFADLEATEPEARPAPAPRTPRRSRVPVGLVWAVLGLAVLGGAVALAWTATRPAKGVLAIEADDPTAEVVVKWDGRVVRDRTRDRDFELPAGEYTVETADGRPGIPDRVTVARGERVWVRLKADAAGIPLKEPVVNLLDSPIAGPGRVPEVPGPSPLDRLDPARIPAAERFPWQPKELVAVIGSHRLRHWGDVKVVVVDPTGRKVATAGVDGIRLWDLKTREPLGEIVEDVHPPACAFLGDGTRLAARVRDDLALFDLSGPVPKRVPWPPGNRPGAADPVGVSELIASRDGKVLVGYHRQAADTAAAIWDLASGSPRLRKVVETTRHVHGQTPFALSADGTRFAYVNEPAKTAVVLALDGPAVTEHATVEVGREGLRGVALSPDGKTLAVLVAGKEVLLFDVSGKTPKRRAAVETRGGNIRIGISPDGRRLAVSYTDVQLFDLTGPDPKPAGVLTGLTSETTFAFTPDGRGVVCGGVADGVGTVRFWDVSGARPDDLEPVDPAVTFAPVGVRATSGLTDTGLLAAWRSDRTTRFWDLTGPAPREAAGGPVGGPRGYPLAAAGSRVVLAGGPAGTKSGTTCWGWQAGALRELAQVPEQLRDGSFSPDGQTLYAIGENYRTLVRWDLSREGQAPAPVPGLETLVEECARVEVSPTGRLVALLYYYNRGGALFDVSGPKAVKRADFLSKDTLTSFVFSPDGTLLAATDVNRVTVYSLRGKNPAVQGSFQLGGTVPSAVFHPDGKRLLIADAFGRVVLWSPATQTVEREWKFPGPVPYARFSADGRHLLTHNSNGTIYVLRLAPPPAAKAANP